MMYMFIKMSSKWFGTAFNFDLDDDLENMKIHIENGNIVCFADDIETFAMEMDIEVAEIEMTE